MGNITNQMMQQDNFLSALIKRNDQINGISIIDYIIIFQNDKCKEYISSKKEYHDIVRAGIEKNLLDGIKELSKVEQINLLRHIYLNSYLLGDDETISKVSKYFDIYIDWRESLNEIEKEIDKINKSGLVIILKIDVIKLYEYYLLNQITIELIKALGFEQEYNGKESTNSTEIEYRNSRHRRKNRIDGKTKKEREFDNYIEDIEELVETLNKYGVINKYYDEKNYLQNHLQGNIDNDLIDIYTSAYGTNKKISNQKKMVMFFDLFRLMMPHRKWLTKDEFLVKEDFNQSFAFNSKNEPYKYDYYNYKAKRISKFIQKK
jgi:hypothetical protein